MEIEPGDEELKIKIAHYLWLLSLAIGTTMGIAIGAAIDRIGACVGIGVGFGVAVGLVLYKRFSRE